MSWHTPEAPPRTRIEALPKATRIIVQYRTKQGKLYELQSASGVLSICIGYGGETPDPRGIRVEARAGTDGDIVEGRASTPAAALREVARTWSSRVPALAPFDWEAVARELQSVHAV